VTDGSGQVFIVDDDASVRRGLARLLRSAGYEVETFVSAQDFLDNADPDGPCCLVLDVRMPGLTGVELQRALLESGRDIPIVFITGHGDIPMAVQAIKAGAVDFLTKPFDDETLLDAIAKATAEGQGPRRSALEDQDPGDPPLSGNHSAA